MRTRRDALRIGAGAGAAYLWASATPLSSYGAGTDTAEREQVDQGELIAAAVGLEQRAVVTYETAATADALERPVRALARSFARQEQQHAAALSDSLQGYGDDAPAKPAAADIGGLEAAIRGGGDAFARFAAELEQRTIGFYYDAIAKIENPTLLATVVRIAANEAQHLTVLRRQLGRDPAPEAFVTGR